MHTQLHTHPPISASRSLWVRVLLFIGRIEILITVRRKQATERVERNFLELLDYLGTQLYTHTDTKHMESGYL